MGEMPSFCMVSLSRALLHKQLVCNLHKKLKAGTYLLNVMPKQALYAHALFSSDQVYGIFPDSS